MKYKIARYILLLSSLLMVLYGIQIILMPHFISDNLEVYANLDWGTLDNISHNLAKYITLLILLLGCFNIITGVVGFIAIYKSFKIKEQWLLLVIFITNIVAYAAPVTFDLTTGVIGWIEIVEIVSFLLTAMAFIVLMGDFKRPSLQGDKSLTSI